MPALFAYLIAVCLLLGGGYGALNWLAAPEPVKVAAKAQPKPKSPPSYEARAEQIPEASPPANSSEASATVAEPPPAEDNERGHELASSANDRPAPQQTAPKAAAPVPVAQPQIAARKPDQKSRLAHAEVPPDEARQKVEQPVKQAARAGSSTNLRTTAAAPDTADPAPKRPPSRQAGNRSEQRGLALMTLRTVEYPDGRRETRLIPYGGSERASAFEFDDDD
jgi:hypothetical protein